MVAHLFYVFLDSASAGRDFRNNCEMKEGDRQCVD